MVFDGSTVSAAVAVLGDAVSALQNSGAMEDDFSPLAFGSEVFQRTLCALRDLAFAEAQHLHLCDDDAHDCAMELVAKALQQAAPLAPAPALVTRLILRYDLPPEQSLFWLKRCARNFALNYKRSKMAREKHEEACYAECAESNYFSNHFSNYFAAEASAPSAEADALSGLFEQEVRVAARTLPPKDRAVFERFHLHEDSVGEIALFADRSPEAVKKSLQRMRPQIRVALAERGYAVPAPTP